MSKPIKLAAVSLGISLVLAGRCASAYESMQGKTEMLLLNEAKAYNGYTLFAAHGTSYLLDMQGNVVHSWNLGTNPKLLDDGHVLDASKNDPSGFGGLVEVDWDGKTVWSYTEARKDYALHHDFVRTYNKKLGAWTTMFIANRTITNEQALAVGADPANAPYAGAQVDAIVEVDLTGKVVWEWWFLDHFIQDQSAARANYAGAGKTVADWPGRLNVNLPGRPLRPDWLHCNSMDYNEDLDQVVVNAVGGEFYVIDHGSTFVIDDPAKSIALAASSAGDFLYRFGDPARYKQGNAPSIPENWTTASPGHKQIGGSHDIHWIRPGLPGAGNFLVFNNGQYLFELTNQSYVDEINPYLDSTGTRRDTYVNPPTAGYTLFEGPKDAGKPKKNLSKQLAWVFGTKSPQGMFSHIGGSAQRLPNGNTLICSDTEGHLLEVTSGTDPQLVWEYVSPATRSGALEVMPDSVPMTNSLFRAYRFGPDHAAFKGRTLLSRGPITKVAPPGDAGLVDSGPAPVDSGIADAGAADDAGSDAGAGPAACTCADESAGCQTGTGHVGKQALFFVIAGLVVAFGALRGGKAS